MQAMKKILNILLPGALALAFVAAPSVVTTVSAQDTTAPAAGACNPEEKAALDKKFRDNRTTNRDVAYQTAQEYLAKCGNDEETKQFVDYLKNWVAKEKVRREQEEKDRIAAENAKRCYDPIQSVAKATSAADKAKVGSAVFSGCQQFASQAPNDPYPVLAPVDYGFVLATSNPPVNTYTDQTIAAAKQAIQKIESNSLGDVKWADYGYKGKDDALAWLNYIIGYITFNNLNGKEAESVPYFYKSLQYNSEIKSKPLPYYAIGFNYRTQYNKAVQDFQAKTQGATDVTEEMKRDLGMQKALADRAIDAFARAYAVAKADPKLPQAAKDARLKDLEQMYKIRNKEQTTGMNELVASVMTKPLPDPASPVTPVIEEIPTTTTGSTAAATATETKSSATTTSGNGNGTRERTAGNTTNTTTTKPAATTKPDAAKPAPKPAPKKPSR
jgi:uncharacterized lipoprotein YehR (DUF1307 family)